MPLSVAEAQKRIGVSFPLEGAIYPEGETWYGHALVFSSPVRVRGSYTFDSGTVTMEGIIEAETIPSLVNSAFAISVLRES